MILIEQGYLVLPTGVMQGTIAIENDKIVEVAPHIEAKPGDVRINAKGRYVLPGGIDTHTHFEMTNAFATTADDFESGTKAAIMGGTTTIINFASPFEESLLEGLRRDKKRAQGRCSCDYKFHMEILNMNEQVAEEIPKVVEEGVASFKVYMAYSFSIDDRSIYEAIKAIAPTGALVAAHCENGAMIAAKVQEMREEGDTEAKYHPLSKPDTIEAEAMHRFIRLGELADYPVHIVHVSSAAGLDVIEERRKNGAKVTCETCPQYLLLTDELYNQPDGKGLRYILSPPLRKQRDVEILQAAVERGAFQTLCTDHCNYTLAQKAQGLGDFTKTPGGLPGVEERMILMWDMFVHSGRIDPVEYMKLTSETPAKLYGLYPKKGTLQVGSDADIVILSPDVTECMTSDTTHSRSDYTPYEGMTVHGRIDDVFLRGHHVVQDRKLVEAYKGEFQQ